MAESNRDDKAGKHSSLRECIEPSAVFLSDFGAVLLIGLLGLVALIIATYALALAVTSSLFIAAYAVAFGFTDIINFGEVHHAGQFARSAFKLKTKDLEGITAARRVARTRLCFSVILFVLVAEEILRLLLKTGPATAEVWVFRFGCLAFYLLTTVVFARHLAEWRKFKRTNRFKETVVEIRKREDKQIL